MKKIAIIGCGGIGSNYLRYFLEVLDIFEKKEAIYIKLFDNDIVEEKNIKRFNQNFSVDDLMMQKAESLAKKYKDYGVDFENILIDETNLSKLDLFGDIILCVDNHKVRKILYDYALKNKQWLIDMRAQGSVWGFTIVDGTYDMDYYNETIFKNPETMERKGSCNSEEDIASDNIQNANKTVAFYIANCIYLNRLRGQDIACKEFKTTY